MVNKNKLTPCEFLSKIDWEGGIFETIEYGLFADDLDDSDPELKEAWDKLTTLYFELISSNAYKTVESKIDHYMWNI